MKKSFRLFCAFISILSFFTFSCQHELLPSPKNETTTDQNQNQETIIGTVPENLVATHGLKGKIELSWQGVQDTARYNIYEAATPYDKFIQIAETTTNTTSYTLEEKSGASKYYKVTAVNRNGKESPFSIVAHGTTLAIPVITYIGQDEQNSDSACSVHWYMNNCNSATYQQNVRYTINCFDPQGNNVAEKIHEGNADYPSIQFEDLTPNTNYSFQITAYIVSHQSDTEISEKVDAATARRLRPNAPENLSATLGTDTTEIKLSFTLPVMVDVALGKGIYEPKPLYFKIYRRVASISSESTEEPWELINAKFATDDFKSQYTPTSPEQPYEPGQIVTFTDTKDLIRGLMYEYKIQSYADGTSREISSDKSFATTPGFLMAVPKFNTSYEMEKDLKGTVDESDDVYSKITTTFDFTWKEMYGYDKNYGFLIGEKRYKLESYNGGITDEIGDAETFTYYSSIEKINNLEKIFDLTNLDETSLEAISGYYTYKLYIIENPGENYNVPLAGSTIDCIAEIKSHCTVLVTQDTSAPEINGFTGEDGYKNKIKLSWIFDKTISKYTITYETEDGTEETVDEEVLKTALENAVDGEIFTFTHEVENGFSATYKLTALRGISVSSNPITLSTLETPILLFDSQNPKYDTISVSWKPANKAESYNLSYSIDGTNYSTPINIPVPKEDVENPENFIVNADNSYTYNFVQPIKYNDASIAGKDVIVKIEATNTKDSTTSNITTQLLGPAKTAVKATNGNFDKITVDWYPVKGAKKYLVKRDRFLVNNTTLESTDIYYVSTDGKTISVQNEESVKDTQLTVSLSEDKNGNPQFHLYDYSYPNSDNTEWKKNQDKMNWGFPYHYTVFPLEAEDHTFDKETGTLAEKVTYENLSAVENVGSLVGYGHNVKATKSEDPRLITITWDKPYYIGNNTPVLWRSKSGENAWEKCSVDIDGTGNFVLEPKGNERIIPYDFAIKYEKSDNKPNQTYLDDLATKVDENNEPNNKGYAFAIATSATNVKINGEAGYQEKISWELWDYSQRARGPKEDAIYTVSIKNNNLGADWKTVATYKNDGTITINNSPEYDTTIEQQGNSIVITPNGLSSDDSAVHNGLLKVLRDYKHYAQVIVTRETSAGVITASFADDEENMYIVRKITEGELCNNVALIVADALYKTGIPYKTVGGSKTKTSKGKEGTFSITGSPVSALDYKNKITWGFDNTAYKHEFSNGISSTNRESITSAFTLTAGNASSTEYASDDNKLYHLPALDITVSHETNEPSYQGTVSISVGEAGKTTTYSLTYKKDGTTIKTLSKDTASNFYKYFPYDLGTDHTDPDKTLNKNFIIYQSPWWN